MASKYRKKYALPENFYNVLEDYSREVLRDQPMDVLEFSYLYFNAIEDVSKYQTIKPLIFGAKFWQLPKFILNRVPSINLIIHEKVRTSHPQEMEVQKKWSKNTASTMKTVNHKSS